MNNELQVKKLAEYTDKLPQCCQMFLMATGVELAISTRLAYANELLCFFTFLQYNHPYFDDKNIKEINNKDLEEITSENISIYLTRYKDMGHAEKTTARKRAALSKFFNYLVDNRYLPFNPVNAAVKVKIHSKDTVTYLNIEEQVNFINAVETGEGLTGKQIKHHERLWMRDRALITFLLDTGMRVSELHNIDIKDIDFDNCSVVVTRKGGNIQTLYFSDETGDILYEYIESKKAKGMDVGLDAPLFTSEKNSRLTIRSIENLVKKYAKASIDGKGQFITPHKMRSSFAMEFYDSTKDILALQKKLGHKNLSATNIYAKATEKQMEETRSILSNKRIQATQNISKS